MHRHCELICYMIDHWLMGQRDARHHYPLKASLFLDSKNWSLFFFAVFNQKTLSDGILYCMF